MNIDMQSTMQRLAQTVSAQFTSTSEQYDRLVLLVDKGGAMLVFHREIALLEKLFSQMLPAGTFQSMRLSADPEGNMSLHNQDPASTSAVSIDSAFASGRAMILMLSDMIGMAWGMGTIAGLLNAWGQSNFITIATVLSRGLDCGPYTFGEVVALNSPQGALNNMAPQYEFDCWSMDEDSPEKRRDNVRVPIIMPDEKSIEMWEQFMCGKGAARGMVFPPAATIREYKSRWEEPPSREKKPEQLVMGLRLLAGDDSFQLAVYVSAVAPLTLPLLEKIQRRMLPGTGPEVLAYLFLSSTLKITRPSADDSTRLYDFRQGVRHLLWRGLRTVDSIIVIDVMFDHLADQHPGGDVVALMRTIAMDESQTPSEVRDYLLEQCDRRSIG